MKVGIDTFGTNHGRSGLGSYLDSLTSNLTSDESVEFELFGAEIDRYTYGRERNFPYKSVHLPEKKGAELLWHAFIADRFASHRKYDVVLYTAAAHMLPVASKVPSVAVVNDLVSKMFSEKSASVRAQIILGLKHSSRIIAASQYICKDLIHLGIPQEKITIIHNGINHSLFYPRELLSPNLQDIKPFAISRPYFIYASRMASPTKKHMNLILAFNIFKEKTHLPHRLVLAGNDGPSTADVNKAAFESPYGSDIFITGYFPHENFPELYAGSDGCIFPSVGEGVGLPVLEAMATGIPVACSASGALPEITGGNALFFDSDNIHEIADAMETIACDKSERTRLIAGGIKWTDSFRWEKTAEQTLRVLREVSKK